MSIKESEAAVLVRFTGMGIIVFNEQKKRGEIAIIRDNKHKLSINVQTPKFKDGSNRDVIVYEDIATYRDLPKENVSLEILTQGKTAIKGFEVYQNGEEFNRLESDDENDFRWIVSLKQFHQDQIIPTKNADGYPLTKLYIENGLFYVQRLDTNLFFEKIEKGVDGSEQKREVFGNVGETIGVKIQSDEVIFKIKIGDTEESHKLNKINGLPHRIEIKNMDYDDNAIVSDMPDYYKYFETRNLQQIELSPVENEEVGGGVTGKTFCHPIEGGGDFHSIDDLD